MKIRFPKINFPFFERNIVGDSFYQINQFNAWSTFGGTNLEVSQNHPILTSAILFLAKLFSQADIYIENKKTGERMYNHWLLELMRKPNYYQTGNDFLETANFTQIATGKAVVWLAKSTGSQKPTSIYLLNPDLIEYPEEFKTPLSKSNQNNKIQNKKIRYDIDGENLSIPIKDLFFCYDLPNGLNTENMFEVRSRIDGLKQTLVNTLDSLKAKNIILKTNGKELVSADGKSGAGSFPLSPDEKKIIEDRLQNQYGTGIGRNRTIVTKASVKYSSLHIALRDLGLDESVKVDGNLIYTALHIPKDILSLEAKKTTYNNFKESMVSFIQNEMQPTLNAFLSVFEPLLEDDNLKLTGNYEKMPIMQFVLIEKYQGITMLGQAMQALRTAGLPDDKVLEICGLDKNIKLEEKQNPIQNGGAEQETDTDEEKREKIIAQVREEFDLD